MEILKLTIIDFDGMENDESSALQHEEVLFHGDKDGLSAHGRAAEYISSLDRKIYLAWNGEGYPKIRIDKIYVK